MATDSIGQVIKFDEDMALRFIEAAERAEANPPAPSNHVIKWGDTEKFMRALQKKYACSSDDQTPATSRTSSK